MKDLTFLLQNIDTIILGICLCVGFALKQAFTWFNNKYIPITMLCMGTIIAIVTNLGNVNAAVILGGMISGLASTGLYEMLRNLINIDGKSDTEGE
ncbi:phage holin family protein [Candidatus Galacturonibacter soehngenii]|uniref:Holin n=1 Tax=Candidatus Galacturonatibacter soehngenii TaxID=2307010 RepID=A0A7V7QJN8_9FIRM|nr:phage holin family protein [Candidatus Galacturonibacter soehngenii]KAB1437548.1 holin [Candidatus Galacturonibacter soehngenii]